MNAKTLALLSVAGMLLSSVSVYSLTPPGGVHLSGGSRVSDDESTQVVPEIATGSVATTQELGHFVAGTTLTVDGRLGHTKLVKNGRGETFVMLEVKGSDELAKNTAPVNLALVIDRSGSMKGSRLTNALNAAVAAVDRLHDGDVVSVVSFDTRTQLVVPPTTIGAGARDRIVSDIRGITLGGDTCISCGIEDALAQIDRTPGRVNRMLLLSDGEATAGVRDVPSFRSIAQRSRDRGTSITTVGVDIEYNERIMSAIAQESNGRHYFVENDAALSRIFEQEADGLTSTVASGVEATIELGPGVELDRVFDRSFQRVGQSVVVPLGAFSRNDVKTVLVKVRVKPGADETVPVADVRLAWRDLVTGNDGRCTGKLALAMVDDPSQASELDPLVAGRVQRSETASTLQQANSLFAQGRGDEARRKLSEQAENVRNVARTATPRASAKAKEVDRDFQRQIAALDEANSGFATPPPVAGAAPNASPASPAPAAESRQGRSQVRKNAERASDMAF